MFCFVFMSAWFVLIRFVFSFFSDLPGGALDDSFCFFFPSCLISASFLVQAVELVCIF